jgi:hypothetical protein
MPYPGAPAAPLSPAGNAPIFPGLMDLPPNVPMGAMAGIPAPDQQAQVIEQIKAMMADPRTRPMAEAYLERFGRNLFAVGLNKATYGLSDKLLTDEALPAYSSGAMDYANRLTKAVKPGEHHGAEMAGTATRFVPLGMLPRLLLRGGSPPATPTLSLPPSSPGPSPPTAGAPPLSPAGSPLPLEPPPTPQGPRGPGPWIPEYPFGGPALEGARPTFPRVVEDLRTLGPEPPPEYPPNWTPKRMEEGYNRALDQPGTVGKRDVPPMTASQRKTLKDYLDKLKKK